LFQLMHDKKKKMLSICSIALALLQQSDARSSVTGYQITKSDAELISVGRMTNTTMRSATEFGADAACLQANAALEVEGARRSIRHL